jgi:hypothetical protein
MKKLKCEALAAGGGEVLCVCVEFPCVQSHSLFRTRICGCELVGFVLPNTIQILCI